MTRGPRNISPADQRRFRVDQGSDPSLVVTGAGEPRVVIVDDHRTLDGEPRPPKGWEDANAEARAVVSKAESEQQARERRRRRERMAVHERLAVVLAEIGTLQSPRAVQYRHTTARSGAESTQTAPAGGRHEDLAHADPLEVARRVQQITLHVEALEDLLDEHRGLSHKSYALMSTDEKNRLLTGPKLRGLSPEQVNALHPELGAPRTIRQVRREAGLDGHGMPRVEKGAA